ncbi:hypothetical protein BSKO_04039 [Bryopsis sp. KO-2023]|nr:hypothetical protein BSKO_04039 [Bryopsis sp. KO-2023]
MDPVLSTSLDFASLDELDPSLVEGYRLFYEREVPLELRTYDGTSFPTEVGTLEALRVKVLIAGDAKRPDAIRVELSSENNLFFNFIHETTKEGFSDLQESQRLMIEFPEYSQLILRLLNCCLKEPHSFLGVMVFTRDKMARLDFIQNMEHKFVELLSLKFTESNEEFVRRQITYRYNNMKSKLAIMHAKLADVNAMVKIKNPSLLLHLNKGSTRSTLHSSRKTFVP